MNTSVTQPRLEKQEIGNNIDKCLYNCSKGPSARVCETQAILDGKKLEGPLPKTRAWKQFLPRYFIDNSDTSGIHASSVGCFDSQGDVPDDNATVQKLVDECIRGTAELDIDTTAEERQEVCGCVA